MANARDERLDTALRERLEMAGCYFLHDAPRAAGEIWFTPHLNRHFTLPHRVPDAATANAVLREAGMEDAF